MDTACQLGIDVLDVLKHSVVLDKMLQLIYLA